MQIFEGAVRQPAGSTRVFKGGSSRFVQICAVTLFVSRCIGGLVLSTCKVLDSTAKLQPCCDSFVSIGTCQRAKLNVAVSHGVHSPSTCGGESLSITARQCCMAAAAAAGGMQPLNKFVVAAAAAWERVFLNGHRPCAPWSCMVGAGFCVISIRV